MARITRRTLLAAAPVLASAAPAPTGVTQFVRYLRGSEPTHGIVEGDLIRRITGDLFGSFKTTKETVKFSTQKLLYPVQPSKVLAVGLNYKSHIGTRTPPVNPEIFYKPITCLQHPGADIVIPKDSKNTHYEGELVIVIGKHIRNASAADAKDAIFGVTCGNDVSERDWQNGAQKDLQWWRAKGADTFGPLGPGIVRGLDYANLDLSTKLNGKVVQHSNTSDLLFDCPTIVSFISRYVTLLPGDLIYTGTPGSTQRMSPGDTVEVEISGIGTLFNRVV
ncbi:fumarylacetoacetate hydrolase family protein [Paludibaculum fermentans]|uniref:Fumarylacetoacetate hydrolase family protein n=1 Tax=Paludibaculum fermentans TaxID=1473598 RepID=A0A7S7NNH4_PALFE|nr:fumarylacetoacetate hydrolase family protein [Paludibaculum fermentans]QOY86855.1 fumarylacetoacetate hydrolase family protein [Paludibaculum fermentans]